MSDSRIKLRPLTRADLPLITPWFEDPDTSRFLGGPAWPATMLGLAGRAAGTIYRGARQIDAHHYPGAAGTPAGYIGCGTFDRCTVDGGEGPDGPIIAETIDKVTDAIAFVIAPEPHGCLEAAGLQVGSERPDFEPMLYYRVWARDRIGRGTRSA